MPVRNEVFRNCDYTSNAIAVRFKTNVYFKNEFSSSIGENSDHMLKILKGQKSNGFPLSWLVIILSCALGLCAVIFIVICVIYLNKSK